MSGGVKAALDEVIDGQGDMADVVQSGLFDDLDVSETGALDTPSPLTRAIGPRKAGPGRRPGSKNRRTEAVTSWLLSQHRHPLSVMMEAYSMSPAELAAAIGMRHATETVGKGDDVQVIDLGYYSNADLLDIFKLQVRMAEAVAPYVAQRQPQAVQFDAKGSVSVSFTGVSLPARGAGPGNSGGDEAIDVTPMKVNLPFKSDG